MMNKSNWWENTPLTEMTREQWEQICDHCAKCCLLKLEDEEDGIVYYTDVACSLLDNETCYCRDYQNRQTLVPDCLQLTIENIDQIQWMPPSCSYRLIKEGRKLPDWHHLVTGDKNSVHKAEQSIKNKYISEKSIDEDELEEHIVEWPLN